MTAAAITVTNEKGGSGKTTAVAAIGAGMARRGKRSLIIDTDPQGHAGYMLGVEKEPAFYDLIVRNARWEDVIRVVPPDRYAVPDEQSDVKGQLLIVPANVEVRNIANSINDVFALLRRIMQIKELVDIILIDTSPTPSLLHAAIYAATDFVLYPTRCEELSIDGLAESMGHLQEFNPFRVSKGLPPAQIMGILPMMFKRNTIDHQVNLDRLKDAFGDLVWDAIPDRIAWAEATSLKRSIFATSPNSRTYYDAMALVDRVEGAMALP